MIKSNNNLTIKIPSKILDLNLSPSAFRLYCEYKRIKENEGACTWGYKKVAKVSKLSIRTVIRATEELARSRRELNGFSLIKILNQYTSCGFILAHKIVVTDLGGTA